MIKNDFFILIPARKGSKGFPYKNRKLFRYTSEIIPAEYKKYTFVSTDDEIIASEAKENNINVIRRPEDLAQDETSMKDVVKHFISEKNVTKNIILLYLTYPQRTWNDVEKIYGIFSEIEEESLVCCEDVGEHPYLSFHNLENNKASLLVDHKLYRRQDYPDCLKLSMFVSCYTTNVIDNLHDLMFEGDTYFHKLENHKIDVDYLDQFKQSQNNKQDL